MTQEMQEQEEKEPEPLMIDAPEKWTPASEVSRDIEIQTADGPAKFIVKALSSADHTKILSEIEKPEAPLRENPSGVPTPNEDDPQYLLANAEYDFKKMVLFANAAWMDIPGDTIDLKAQWASENLWRRDELRQLYYSIIEVSGFSQAVKRKALSKPITVADPAAWSAMSKRPVEVVLMSRQLCFRLTPINRAHSQHIEHSCPIVDAPMMPAPGKSIKLRQFVKNERDPKYLAQLRAVEEKRVIMVLEHSLDWKIPGETFEQKSEWLRKRPAGEVSSLYGYILRSVNGFQTRTDFM